MSDLADPTETKEWIDAWREHYKHYPFQFMKRLMRTIEGLENTPIKPSGVRKQCIKLLLQALKQAEIDDLTLQPRSSKSKGCLERGTASLVHR